MKRFLNPACLGMGPSVGGEYPDLTSNCFNDIAEMNRFDRICLYFGAAVLVLNPVKGFFYADESAFQGGMHFLELSHVSSLLSRNTTD